MKIAFLGKGGSGKSTMATTFVRKLQKEGFNVLAIDADHNMDLSYNLGVEPSMFLGSDPEYIKEYVGAKKNDTYKNSLQIAREKGISFRAFPGDEYTNKFSIEIEDNLKLITAGPHTDKVRSGDACSHSLAAPLKVYLPLLRLNPKEAVVIDERAGTDPVATGILNGVDLAVIVREQTLNSSRVVEQIRKELELQNIQYLIIENKLEGVENDTKKASEQILKTLLK